MTGDPFNPLGLALCHPLHHWLGRVMVAANLFEPCLAVTLISALAAAVAVAVTCACVLRLTESLPASVLAAASLGLAHTFWQMATLAETYALAAALLSLECYFLIRFTGTRQVRYLLLMCLFNGLGISNHLLALLTTPVVAVIVLLAALDKIVRAKYVLGAVVIWLAGSSLYGGMVIAELARSGDWQATIHSALFGYAYADEVLNVTLSLRGLAISAAFVTLCFPNLLLPAGVHGIVRSGRLNIPRRVRRALLAGLIIHLVFVARYDIVDQHTFLVPAYVLLSIFGGVGFAVMLKLWPPHGRRIGLTAAVVLVVLTPVLYAVMPTVAREFDVLKSVARDKPYRDDYVYLFTPWSVAERSADMMSREAVTLAGKSGLVLVEDEMAEFAVRYRAIRDGLNDLRITSDINPQLLVEAGGQAGPVVLVPFKAGAPRIEAPGGTWQRIGDLYVLRAERKDPGDSSHP